MLSTKIRQKPGFKKNNFHKGIFILTMLLILVNLPVVLKT